mgnify:CR=1 FL=1
MADERLYIAMLSLHGLVRGERIELGRDADTGGQVQYVVDLARALSAHPDVGRVDLFTRQVFDRKVDPEYAQPVERLAERAWLVRVPFGPGRYLRKEALWPYLDELVAGVLAHVRRIDHFPDLIHGHYADAGLAATRLAGLLGVPMGVLFGGLLFASFVGSLAIVTPWSLTGVLTATVLEMALPLPVWIPLLSTAVLTVLCVGLTLWKFRRLEF